ncbi:hypothetical protein SAMN05216389_105117 [Oceanobacillus limi]|uniref:Uncharacterized protein n=1 Tax=Oceanobacillus limi TaxID=930131 RepID=A0A1I0BR11_9BACI|nr:hypothetical protein [Oceanobacillus limi]SET08767.1 hypothetical protein SAMN05216389_105117 [Oceanobacillus limi]
MQKSVRTVCILVILVGIMSYSVQASGKGPLSTWYNSIFIHHSDHVYTMILEELSQWEKSWNMEVRDKHKKSEMDLRNLQVQTTEEKEQRIANYQKNYQVNLLESTQKMLLDMEFKNFERVKKEQIHQEISEETESILEEILND